MTFNDKSKIIEGLQHCSKENCEGCPYRPEAYEDYMICSKQPMLDAMEYLQHLVQALNTATDCLRIMFEEGKPNATDQTGNMPVV